MAFSRFVLDASVTIEWFLPNKPSASAYAGEVLKAIEARELLPMVPDLWHYEIGSVLVAAKRRRRISAKRLTAIAEQLAELRPFTINPRLTEADVITKAGTFHLQGYDTVYFDLAKRLRVPIASTDGGIRTACRTHSVELWQARVHGRS
jgi:predicted nucleic acid-binding protein